MGVFYNEIEPFAAAWLRELIKAGVIADGEVSEADMWDVVPSELMGFNQVHLCAGIGGWSAALRLAGWPDDKPVWTVSLPCQPFSAAGKGAGLADERGQLADAFFWLAGICRPDIIFGEQVEAAIKHDWWDVMASSLESIDYTVGAVGFPASSVGAFHLRQRLYWVVYSKRDGRWSDESGRQQEGGKVIRRRSPACGVADAEGRGCGISGDEARTGEGRHADGADELGDSEDKRRERRTENYNRGRQENKYGSISILWDQSCGSMPVNFWSDAEWLPCRDGKARPAGRGIHPLVLADASKCIKRGIGAQHAIDGLLSDGRGAYGAEGKQQREEAIERLPQSGFFPLVNGISRSLVPSGDNGPSEDEANATAEARVGRLRGYGNAICVPAAAEFIKAFLRERSRP